MNKIWAIGLTASLSLMSVGNTFASEPAKAAPAAAKEPTYAERLDRGKQIAGAVCVACHGLDGISPIAANPNISGMASEYIAKQLEHFKSATRQNAIMQGMVANLTPADMKALGDYYFAQRGKSQAAARDEKVAKRGQQIYRAGIPEAKVPACASCHGATGAGMPAQFPKVGGQWPEYTLAELKEYAAGSRKNVQMNAIAARMKESDLIAVSEYMAGMRPR